MQVEARFRRRPSANEQIPALHSHICRDLFLVRGLWNESSTLDQIGLDLGTGESAASDLTPALAAGIKGAVSYVGRSWAVQDQAKADDFLSLQLDLDAIDFAQFCREIFPQVVAAFKPYRAAVITDIGQDLDDFDLIIEEVGRTGTDVDGRDTVYRIWPANYFDDEMCNRAFGLAAADVVSKAAMCISRAALFHGGALLGLADEPVTGQRLDSLDDEFFKCLYG